MSIAPRIKRLITAMDRVPNNFIALEGRYSVAAEDRLSAQTKVEGYALNIVSGEWTLGWPRLSASVVDLFREEYRPPWLPPKWAALAAAWGENIYCRLSAAGHRLPLPGRWL